MSSAWHRHNTILRSTDPPASTLHSTLLAVHSTPLSTLHWIIQRSHSHLQDYLGLQQQNKHNKPTFHSLSSSATYQQRSKAQQQQPHNKSSHLEFARWTAGQGSFTTKAWKDWGFMCCFKSCI
ncbi:hypothetical protein MYU51_015665 [Penicillium brevicompactum]